MIDFLSSPEVALLMLLLGILCVVWSLTSWVAGIQLLIVTIFFGGIVGVRLGNGALPIVFRDLFIVLPLYAAFLASGAFSSAIARLPADLALGLCLIGGWLIICLFNPNQVSILQLMIGLKVWVLYMPFLAVGMALAVRPDAMFRVFRTLLWIGLVACGVGLLQSFLIRIIGYQPAITLFFGEGASAATQNFTHYSVAGGIYRVPGTFSFNSQYVGFLFVFLTVAIIVANSDPDPWYQRFARGSIFVALLAGLLSGTKGALVTFPVFIMGYFFFGLIRSRLLIITPIAVMLGVWVVSAIGLDIPGLFSYGVELTERYSQNLVFDQIDRALTTGAIGNGIGSNTNGARYVRLASEFGSSLGLESYYAKIAAEMGTIGLMIFGFFLASIFVRSIYISIKRRGQRENNVIAPLAIFIAFTLVSSFKGSPIDVDPSNIFFWLSLGILIGVDRSAAINAFEHPIPEAMTASAGT